MRLVDTDILVDLLRQHAPAVAWFAQVQELPSVPGLAAMEVIQGCRNAAEVGAVQILVGPLPVVWPTEPDCQRAMENFSACHLSHGLGLIDALIGACAVGLGATLCTFNVRHYQHIPALETEQPYSR